jgi:hypothetical protein
MIDPSDLPEDSGHFYLILCIVAMPFLGLLVC